MCRDFFSNYVLVNMLHYKSFKVMNLNCWFDLISNIFGSRLYSSTCLLTSWWIYLFCHATRSRVALGTLQSSQKKSENRKKNGYYKWQSWHHGIYVLLVIISLLYSWWIHYQMGEIYKMHTSWKGELSCFNFKRLLILCFDCKYGGEITSFEKGESFLFHFWEERFFLFSLLWFEPFMLFDQFMLILFSKTPIYIFLNILPMCLSRCWFNLCDDWWIIVKKWVFCKIQ